MGSIDGDPENPLIKTPHLFPFQAVLSGTIVLNKGIP